ADHSARIPSGLRCDDAVRDCDHPGCGVSVMADNALLLLLLLIPAGGAAVGALLPHARTAKTWALLVSLATAAVALVIAFQFDWARGKEIRWGFAKDNPFTLDSIQFGLKLGADAVSLWLVFLTVLL